MTDHKERERRKVIGYRCIDINCRYVHECRDSDSIYCVRLQKTYPTNKIACKYQKDFEDEEQSSQ